MRAISVGLLCLTRNNPEEALQLAGRLRSHVDEIVVVDSSDPERWSLLEKGLDGPNESVARALPTGYSDLLVPFGVAALRTDWVFQCDPDEYPSNGLLARLREPGNADGFVVLRREATVGGVTRHLRLFRRTHYSPANPSYGFPSIRGTVVSLPSTECLVHRREYRDGPSGDRWGRYMDIESIERPPDDRWLRDATTLRLGPRSLRVLPGLGQTSTPGRISPPAQELGMILGSLLDLVASRSPGYAIYTWRYRQGVRAYLRRLGPAEVERRYRLTLDIRSNGGLVHYLGFDRPEYVRRLTATFGWDREGLSVLHELLRVRFESRQILPEWAAAARPDARPPSTGDIAPGGA